VYILTSNYSLEYIDLLKNLDESVYLLYINENKQTRLYKPDKTLHMFFNSDKKDLFEKKYSVYNSGKTQWMPMKVINILYEVITKDYKGLMLHGFKQKEFSFEEIFFSKDELCKYKDAIITTKLLIDLENEKVTCDQLLYNIMDKFFFFYDDLRTIKKSKNDEDIDPDNCIRLFTTTQYLEKHYKHKNNSNNDNDSYFQNTLRQILKNTQKVDGIIIDEGSPHSTLIPYEFFSDYNNETKQALNRFFVQDRIDYYKMLDEFYTVLSEQTDIRNKEAFYNHFNLSPNTKIVHFFENYEEACHFADSICKKYNNGTHLVGKITKENFQQLLQNLLVNDISYIYFDYTTYNFFKISTEDICKQFNVPYIQRPKTSKKATLPFVRKSQFKIVNDERKKIIENITTSKWDDFLSEATIDDLLYACNILQKKTKTIRLFENNNTREEIYAKTKFALISRLSECPLFYFCHKENNFNSAPIIYVDDYDQTKLINTTPLSFIAPVFNELAKTFSEVMVSTTNDVFAMFSIKELLKTLKLFDECKNERDQIIFYLVSVEKYTIEDARTFFIKLYCRQEQFKEFIDNLQKYNKEFQTAENSRLQEIETSIKN
jgi:hypothetical protein